MSLVATVMLLLLIDPQALTSRSGISYYGNFLDTLLPYAVGLGLTGFFLVRAANSLPHRGHKPNMIRLALRVSALSLAGIVVTPSLASNFTGFWHGAFAGLLFFTQATVTWKLAAELWRNLIDRTLIVLHIVSVAAIVLSFRWFSLFDVMIPAQVTAATAFGILCMRIIVRLEPLEHHAQSPAEGDSGK
jgi:hypothetical protein